MAAAHVSAAFATLLSIDPSLTNADLIQLVKHSANTQATNGCGSNMCGAGALNAKQAADLLLSPPADQVFEDEPDGLSISAVNPTQLQTAAAGVAIPQSAISATGRMGLPDLAVLLGILLLGSWRTLAFHQH